MKYRVLRGGSYDFGTECLRFASRNWCVPEVWYWDYGFRIVVVRRKP